MKPPLCGFFIADKEQSIVNDQVKQKRLFPLGQTVATPGALEAIEEADETAIQLYFWHQCGNWGDVPPRRCSRE